MRILVSHNDLDGLGSIILALQNHLNFDQIWAVSNGKEIMKLGIRPDDQLIIADLSLSLEEIKRLCCEVEIYDHHLTFQKELSGLKRVIIDPTRCGTKLFYQEYMEKKDVNEMVENIDAYDRWQEESPRFEDGFDLNCLMIAKRSYRPRPRTLILNEGKRKSNPFDGFISSMIRGISRDDKELIREIREAKEKEYKESVIPSIDFRQDKNNINFALYDICGDASYFGNRILKENREIKYVVGYASSAHFNHLSIRSRKDFDILKYSGGFFKGHPNAAGCDVLSENIDALCEGDILDIFELKRNEEYP